MNSKLFWYAHMTGVFFLWPGIIIAGYVSDNLFISYIVFGTLLLIHTLEVKKGLSVGKENGFSSSTSVIMTLIFGYTWWVPVKKGVIKK